MGTVSVLKDRTNLTTNKKLMEVIIMRW